MSSSVKDGFCSHCHKVWTLDTPQGVCQWCGKRSTCQTIRANALPSLKSSRRRSQRQAATGNGYDQLEGDWLTRYKVASRYAHKAQAQDREDLLHDIITTLADATRHKPISYLAMLRVASRTVADYWRTQYRLTNGLDCGSCSKAQRQRCRKKWLYPECPKAIRVESLDKPIVDGEGNLTRLGELIADDRAIDLDAWLEAKTYLLGYPKRLIEIGQKRLDGKPLTKTDRQYLWRFRKTEQKTLVPM